MEGGRRFVLHKLLAVFMAAAIIFSGGSGIVVNASTSLVSEGFQSFTDATGTAYPSTGGSFAPSAQGTSTIQPVKGDVSDPNNVYLRLSTTSGSSSGIPYISKSVDLSSNTTILSGRFRINTATSGFTHNLYFRQSSTQYLTLLKIYKSTSGSVATRSIQLFPKSNGAETLASTVSLNENQWYKLDVVLNSSTYTVNVFLDNVCIAPNKAIPSCDLNGATYAAINTFNFNTNIRYDIFSANNATTTLDLDDINWYRPDPLAAGSALPSGTDVSCSTPSFVMNFNNEMDKGTLTASNIDVTKTKDGTTSPVSGVTIVPSNKSFTVNFPGLLDGNTEYNVTVKSGVRDLYLQNMTQTTRSFTTGAQNAPPTVSISSPVTGTRIDPGTDIPFVINAADADGSIASVELYKDGDKLGDAVWSNGVYTYTWTGAAVGNAVITAKAADNNGDTTISAPINLYVNFNQLPQVSITSPANVSRFKAGESITITVNASDPDVSGSIGRVEFYDGENLLGTAVQSPYSYMWNSVSLGEHILTAKAYDNEGAVSVSSPVNTAVVQSEFAEKPVIHTLDFIQDSQLTDNFSTATPENSAISVETVPAETNRAIQISVTGNSSRTEPYISTKGTFGFGGKVLLQQRVRMEDTYTSRYLFKVTGSTGSFDLFSTSGAKIFFSQPAGAGGSVEVYSFIPGQWVDLKVIMDLDTNQADVYINNAFKNTYTMNRTAGGTFTSIRNSVVYFSTATPNTSYTYYDDLKISRLVTAPAIVSYKLYDASDAEVTDKTNAPLAASKMVVTFSEHMDAATLIPENLQLVKGLNNTQVNFAGAYNDALMQYTVSFDQPLDSATAYKFILKTGVENSQNGIPFSHPQVLDFQTTGVAFKVMQMELINSSGDQISALIPNEVVHTKVKVRHNAGPNRDVVAILALYNGEQLEKVVTSSQNIDGGSNSFDVSTGTLTIPATLTNRQVKVLVWSSLDEMKPLVSEPLTVQ